MVTGVWCLMALVLVSGYTGNLIFYLTVPTIMPIVNTFEDVAARSDPRLILDAKSYFAERILVTHLTSLLGVACSKPVYSECRCRYIQNFRRLPPAAS